MQIKRVRDETLLTEAFLWADAAPRWFRESQEDETQADFLRSAKDKLFYGLFDEEFTALLRFNPAGGNHLTVDLFARRSTDWNKLAQACLSVKTYLFDIGAGSIGGWIPRKNRGIVKLYRFLGFTHSGLRCYRGKYHGRAAEWLYFEAKSVDLGREIT